MNDNIEKLSEKVCNLRLSHFLHTSQSHATLREWQSRGTTHFNAHQFVLPLFIINDDDRSEPIDSMPNVNRMGINVCCNYLRPLVQQYRLKSVLLFPVISDDRHHCKQIDDALDSERNASLRLIPLLKQQFPQLLVIVDVCLCTFSSDGHCCVFDQNGRIDNQSSIELLAKISVSYALAGAHVIAPSDMMDARIFAIRTALRDNGLSDVAILSYASKFSSCFYGPFRDAAGSAPKFGDRKCYQLPIGSRGLALRAVERDIEEGCDAVMVKPALAYLDIIAAISAKYENFPIAVYNVSGEYAMLCHGATNGAFELKTAVMEVMTSFQRAGANIFITYFTPLILQWLKEE